MTAFDARRALLVYEDIFGPFDVTVTRPLQVALARGDVHKNALVLVTEREAATIVLLRRQLTYHHVAQGETQSEPWMVSF